MLDYVRVINFLLLFLLLLIIINVIIIKSYFTSVYRPYVMS